jgi:hypothetical protein
MPGGAFIAPIFFHFTLLFPKGHKILKNKFVIIIIYLPTFVLYLRGLLIDVSIDNLEISSLGYYTTNTLTLVVGGQVYLLHMGLIGGLIAIGILVLFNKYRQTKVEIEKNQIKYMITGTSIFLGIGFFTDIILPSLGFESLELVSLFFTISAAIITYAIVKYKLMAEVGFVSEEIRAAPIAYQLEPGYTYIINEREPIKGFKLFAKAVSRGSHGICITGKNPKLIRDKYGLKRTPIIWISEKEDPKEITVDPAEIVNINELLKPFIDTSKNSVVILVDDRTITKGLVGIKNRQKILKISKSIFDTISHRNSRFIISSKPGSITTGKSGSIIKTRRPLLEFNRLSSFVLEETCNKIINNLINTGTLTTEKLNEKLNALTNRDSFFLNKATIKITSNIFTDSDNSMSYIKINSALSKDSVIDKTKSFISVFEDLPRSDALHTIALKTLKSYGYSEAEYLFHTGDTYIIKEPKSNYSFQVFGEFLSKDYHGLGITKSNPKKVMRTYNLHSTAAKMFWLTDVPSPNISTIFPKLENISAEIERFLRETPEKKVIIFDGIEYLITYSGDMFESVLRSLRKLTDRISMSNACLIIPLDPTVVSKERMALLSRSGIEIITPPK